MADLSTLGIMKGLYNTWGNNPANSATLNAVGAMVPPVGMAQGAYGMYNQGGANLSSIGDYLKGGPTTGAQAGQAAMNLGGNALQMAPAIGIPGMVRGAAKSMAGDEMTQTMSQIDQIWTKAHGGTPPAQSPALAAPQQATWDALKRPQSSYDDQATQSALNQNAFDDLRGDVSAGRMTPQQADSNARQMQNTINLRSGAQPSSVMSLTPDQEATWAALSRPDYPKMRDILDSEREKWMRSVSKMPDSKYEKAGGGKSLTQLMNDTIEKHGWNWDDYGAATDQDINRRMNLGSK